MSNYLEEEIKKIPNEEDEDGNKDGDGFWKSGAEKAYINLGHELKAATNWSDDRIINFLTSCYWSAAYCFGR